MIRIAVVNQSTVVCEPAVGAIVKALQIQVYRDLYHAWGTYAFLYHLPKTTPPDADMWVLGIFDDADQAGALGYHDVTPTGQPLGKAFAKTSAADHVAISAVVSHELLEMLGDPDVNLVVQDASNGRKFWANELCDAVEDDSDGYLIAGVLVSDFVLPAYFQPTISSTGPWDFQKKLTGPVPSLTPGGYMAYVENGVWQQVFGHLRSRRLASKPGGSGRIARHQRPLQRSTFQVRVP